MISCLIIRPPPDDTTKNKRAFLPILKPLGPDDGIKLRRKFPPKFCKTLTGRLPPEDGSARPQTLGKRVSDDSRHFIVRRQNKNLRKFSIKKFVKKLVRRKIDKLPVFAELWIFGRNRQMRLEKLPPKF